MSCHIIHSFIHPPLPFTLSISLYLLRPTPTRIPRPINSPLHMSRDPILARVELAANRTFFAEGPAYFLADLSDCAVGVELLAYCSRGGD
jgi:hypothetical protein